MTKEELKQDIEDHEFILKFIQNAWDSWTKEKQDQNYPLMMNCINRINWAKTELENPGPVGRVELKA